MSFIYIAWQESVRHLDAGVSVSESEIFEEIEGVKKAMHDGAEGEKQLKAVVAGTRGNEDEYWERVRTIYAKKC